MIYVYGYVICSGKVFDGKKWLTPSGKDVQNTTDHQR